MWQITLGALMEPVLDLLGAILMAVLTAAAGKAFQYWKVKIDEKHMRVLHSALMTAIRAGLQRGLSPETAVNSAVTYAATTGAKDAVEKLGASKDTLRELATAKLNEVQQGGGA